MKENWMCGKLLKVIDPDQRPCVEGVKRFDISEISLPKVDSKVQQVDVSPYMPVMPLQK